MERDKAAYLVIIAATVAVTILFWEPPNNLNLVFALGPWSVFLGSIVLPWGLQLSHGWFFASWIVAAVPLLIKYRDEAFDHKFGLAVVLLIVGVIGFASDFYPDVIQQNDIFTNPWGTTISYALGELNAYALIKLVD